MFEHGGRCRQRSSGISSFDDCDFNVACALVLEVANWKILVVHADHNPLQALSQNVLAREVRDERQTPKASLLPFACIYFACRNLQ